MGFIVKILVSALAVLLGAWLLPGVEVVNLGTAVMVAVVLAILNTLIKPVLVILTIPVTLITLGLFLLVINAVIILLADALVGGFVVEGFWWALLFSLILSFLSSIFEGATRKKI